MAVLWAVFFNLMETMNRRKFLKKSLYGAGGLGLLTGLYTWQVEPFWYEFVYHKMPIKNLPPELDGKRLDYLPAAVEDQLLVKPIYKKFKGWKTSTKGIKTFKDLPKNAQEYIKELEKFIETKVASISTSPERKDTILIENPFSI